MFHLRIIHDDSTFREAIGNFILQKYSNVILKYTKSGMVKHVETEDIDIATLDLPKITPINLSEHIVKYTSEKLNKPLDIGVVNNILESL